jgi:radical SAM protein with 4Fe4S-binding SPASM domain
VPTKYRVNYKALLAPDELNVDEILAFTDMLRREHNLRFLSITGGEPLLRTVWPRTRALLKYANQWKMPIQLNTNGCGQISAKEVVECFDDAKLLLFALSLDGARAETVDRFRGQHGFFDALLSAIREAVRSGAVVQTRLTANRRNIAEAVDVYRLASELSVDTFKVKPMFAAGAAIDNHDALLGSEEEVRDLQERLIALSYQTATKLYLPPPVFVNPEPHRNGNVRFGECTCGQKCLYLSPDGDIYPCTYIVGDLTGKDFVVGNVRDPNFNFAREWVSSPAIEVYRKNRSYAKCPTQILLAQRNVNRNATCTIG